MISAYDYVHARNDYSADDRLPETATVVRDCTNPAELARIADDICDAILVPSAADHLPAVIVRESDVADAIISCKKETSAVAQEAARPIAIMLVDWLRRNTQFRNISYTGNGADFVIEP